MPIHTRIHRWTCTRAALLSQLCAAVLLAALPTVLVLAAIHSCVRGHLASALHCGRALPSQSPRLEHWSEPAWWHAPGAVLTTVASMADWLSDVPGGTWRGAVCAWMADTCVERPWAQRWCAWLLGGVAVAVLVAAVGRAWYGVHLNNTHRSTVSGWSRRWWSERGVRSCGGEYGVSGCCTTPGVTWLAQAVAHAGVWWDRGGCNR